MLRAYTSASRPVQVGTALFVLGLLFIAADVIPFFAGDHNRPLWLNLACLLAPAGFLIAMWAGLRAGRADARAALRAIEREPTGSVERGAAS